MKKVMFFALVCIVIAPFATAQDVRIGVTGQVDRRLPVAVPPFAVADPGLAGQAQEMAQTLADDLAFSGLFVVLTPDKYPAGFTGTDPDVARIPWDAWHTTPAMFLVHGVLLQQGTTLIGQFRLFSLANNSQVAGLELKADAAHPRLAPHRFSEEVIRFTDGTPGIGTSEITFSAGKTGNKEIWVSDYDGANAKQVTNHGSISIKPKMSPDGRRIAYLSYKDRYCFLYVFDRLTGKASPLSKEVGLNSAPTWAPDGNTLAMTLSKDGNTEIYLRNPDGSNPRRLTNNKDGDTSPSFSPDGSQIAFVSDRGGKPQIYKMNVDGSGQERLSYQGGSAYDPVWSPDGKYIAYCVERSGEGFQIYALNAANPSESFQLTKTGNTNESPSWSADSRHVIFMSTRGGAPQLYTVTLATGEERKVPRLTMSCEGPSWGPRRGQQ